MQAPLPPPEQNAAPLYTQLMNLLKTRPLSTDDKIADAGVRRRLPPRDQFEKIRRALRHRPDITALVHQAATSPKCVFVRNWALGPDMPMPEYATMRMAARWLSAENAVLLADGKPLEAVRTQALCYRIAHQATMNPDLLLSVLVGIVVDATSEVGMERVLYRAGSDPKVAEAVRRTIDAQHTHFRTQNAFHGELYMGLVSLDILRKQGPAGLQKFADMIGRIPPQFPTTAPASPSARQAFARSVDANGVIYIRLMRQVATAFTLPYPQARVSLRAEAAELERKKDDPNYAFIRFITPVYEPALNRIQKSDAHAAVVSVSAAVLAWKARHGSFPARLDVVMSAVPRDPFDGKPLRYRLEGKGFVVYSVDPSGKFDGGTPNKKPDSPAAVFRYPLPAYVK